LLAEHARGSRWQLVGLDIDWPALEKLFSMVDLPPQVAGRASRVAVPVYRRGKQIGQATSLTFSPILKKYIALGTLETAHAALGGQVEIEITVEYSRQKCPAVIVKTPFFNPPRKRA
jgi:aminomethyltransferase